MEKLIDILELWTKRNDCPICDDTIQMMKDISQRKDNSIHSFTIVFSCHKDMAHEIHIRHHNSRK